MAATDLTGRVILTTIVAVPFARRAGAQAKDAQTTDAKTSWPERPVRVNIKLG